ncbi:interleukin-21 receptor isoform X2 [Rhineura floridana]|uniref:interleukin-21 receptor isoform X2 n=1 Tax=Rhineura floridana TaxID=261503 RepID=UPI002AC88620|nr:interleukin-21 receptor isoform X2 [Rhineura floridana]
MLGGQAWQLWWPALPLLVLQQASACMNLTCFADYIQTLTCTWGSDLHASSRALYNITARWNCGEGGSCPLLPAPSRNGTHLQYACFAEQHLCFGNNFFDVEITKRVNESLLVCSKNFVFQENIKPHPPFHLMTAASPTGYNISWETKYQHQEYNYLNGKLQYQLRYRQRGHPWQGQRQKLLLQDAQTTWLLPREFEGDAEYALQVRARPREDSSYRGAWSDWSPEAALRTLPRKASGAGGVAGWLVLLLLVLGLSAVLVASLGRPRRLWKKLEAFVPSPAPFFQPLYLSHNGDFKKWVGSSSCSGPTLDAFEWSTALLEVFGISHKHLPSSPAKGEQSDGQEALPATSTSQLPGGSQDPTQEQAYGHLSIETVTVAGDEFATCCCPRCNSGARICCALEQQEEESERDAYRGIHFYVGGSSGQISRDVLPPSQGKPFPSASGSWPGGDTLLDTLPAVFPQAGGSLGRKSRDGAESFGLQPLEPWGLEGLSSLEEDLCSYGGLLSPDLDADSDLASGLDLDTMDSGFADCDCGSPVDCEFNQRRHSGCGSEEPIAVKSEGKREAFLPSYVKHWVSCQSRAQPS